ncbi:MAG: hypothetical protein Q8L45_08030 [Xanthomonadaceae bacterium]|nr:hypothetical protein [Xanthomonadaceae bacterium]MDP2185332.1 hypothetical protein [Xanthomonadales bacterium]
MTRLQRTKLRNVTEADKDVHPDGQLTLLHPATAIMMFDAYIFELGGLVRKDSPQGAAQIGYWIDPNWTFVAAFVEGFHRCISELMFRLDKSLRQERGYSALETMKVRLLRPESEPEVLLESHARTIDDLYQRVLHAIDGRAFTESVALQERMLTALLRNTLEMHELDAPDTLVELINSARELDAHFELDTACSLWDRVHAWRRERNKAIHGPRSSVFEAPISIADADAQAHKTAEMGVSLIDEVRTWCIEARARSLDMSLPRPRSSRPAH